MDRTIRMHDYGGFALRSGSPANMGVFVTRAYRTDAQETPVDALVGAKVELLGVSACLPGILPAPSDPPEVVLRLAVADRERGKVERFGKEIAPLVTAGPPGVTGFAGGRPKPQEVVAYWPALLARDEVERHLVVSVEAI
jgi:hypothetical protein